LTTLEALCTTLGADLDVAARVEAIADARLLGLLAELDARGFADLDEPARVAELHRQAQRDLRAMREAKALVLGLFYALPEPDGRNPNWDDLGYPGPASPPPDAPKTIPLSRPRGTIRADVCVVGSGAGGSVIAARLQQAGLDVVVLEQGAYRNEADFRQLELASSELYLRGGLFFNEEGTLGLLAGSTLGGGTVINSMVCLRTPEYVQEQWKALGVDVTGFDRHLDAVWERLGVNTTATRRNVTSRLLAAGLDAEGLAHETIARNCELDDDPAQCGYCHYGCQRGSKRSTLKTYLQDAADAGSRIVAGCRVEQILVEDGQATGVRATLGGEELVAEATTVVVAGGGIESPALLLRSGIGGPAAGKNLRVHPTYFVAGVYDEPVEGWSGQVQSVVSFEGDGFLIESTTLAPGMWAGLTPWEDAASHRRAMLELRHVAPWHGVAHDHGSGSVAIDAGGNAVVHWELSDDRDRQIAAAAHVAIARLHRAAGAREITSLHWHGLRWREGDDFEEYVRALESADHGAVAYSAHQMGSCRMGADPATSVADGSGELHDTSGVWIGDASAFPTAPGVNPMITIMALAHRTAEEIQRRST
jgi:glycine/D-amino acid oxidase-like deaminating enzyme